MIPRQPLTYACEDGANSSRLIGLTDKGETDCSTNLFLTEGVF